MKKTNKIRKSPYVLWVDDERDPFTRWFHEVDKLNPAGLPVVWVKSYTEFVQQICVRGLPYFVSFDHDLGKAKETGYDCVMWLIERCLDTKMDLPNTNVHSANPIGADRIRQAIGNFDRAKQIHNTWKSRK